MKTKIEKLRRREKFLELHTRVKSVDANGLGGVEGYATTFDAIPDLDGDRVLPGAAGVDSFQVPMLAYHDKTKPVGSAAMTPNALGVLASGTYANTVASQEMRELVVAKAVPAFSIGFWSDDYTPNDFGGVDFRTIHIYEVSLVLIPANPRALVTAAKSLGGMAAIDLAGATEKQYIDVEPPVGSYEAIQEDIRESICDIYGPNSYVSILSTWPDRVAYAVESYPAAPLTDGTWQATYSFDEDGDVVLGEPTAVEVQQTIVSDDDDAQDALDAGSDMPVTTKIDEQLATHLDGNPITSGDFKPVAEPAAETKAGKRNRANDQMAINAAHDNLVQAGADCSNMIGDAKPGEPDEPDEPTEGDDDKKALETAKGKHPTSRPNLKLLTEIAELEAEIV